MNAEFRFEDLRVYQEAIKLSSDIFSVTILWPPVYRFSLGDQLNRAGLSIPLNIAEGSSRSRKDFQHFLSISRGSSFECISILTIARMKNLLTEREYSDFRTRIHDIAKMLSSLRTKLTN